MKMYMIRKTLDIKQPFTYEYVNDSLVYHFDLIEKNNKDKKIVFLQCESGDAESNLIYH